MQHRQERAPTTAIYQAPERTDRTETSGVATATTMGCAMTARGSAPTTLHATQTGACTDHTHLQARERTDQTETSGVATATTM